MVLDEPSFIHETARIYGMVFVVIAASVWPYVVMRAEFHESRIVARSNIQDFVMVHTGYSTPTVVGEDCSIVQHVTLHGCDIGDRCLIGINATIMDVAKIGANSVVAGHTIVREGTEYLENSIIAGVPSKLVGTRDSGPANLANARFYHQNALNYAAGIDRLEEDVLKAIFGKQPVRRPPTSPNPQAA